MSKLRCMFAGVLLAAGLSLAAALLGSAVACADPDGRVEQVGRGGHDHADRHDDTHVRPRGFGGFRGGGLGIPGLVTSATGNSAPNANGANVNGDGGLNALGCIVGCGAPNIFAGSGPGGGSS